MEDSTKHGLCNRNKGINYQSPNFKPMGSMGEPAYGIPPNVSTTLSLRDCFISSNSFEYCRTPYHSARRRSKKTSRLSYSASNHIIYHIYSQSLEEHCMLATLSRLDMPHCYHMLYTISSMPFRGCKPLDTDLQKICSDLPVLHLYIPSYISAVMAFSTLKKVGSLHHFIVEDHRRSKVVFATTAGSFERDC